MKKIVFLFLSLFSILASAEQLIVEPEMGRTPLLEKINKANQSVELVIYGFTDQALLNALIKQKQLGRQIRVILEKTPYKFITENDDTSEALDRNHIDRQGEIPPYDLIHQKTLIIDHHQAIVMTFNFTNATFKQERNFAVVLDNPQMVHAIDSTFQADWQHTPTPSHLPDLIYSPDDSRTKLIALINHAKNSLNIYAQNISDYKITGALAKAARSGVKINILTSSSLTTPQATYLSNAGVVIRKSKHFYIHAKAMVIDDREAVIGSINFTQHSIDANRELSVVSRDQGVVKQLNKVFAKDWGESKESTGHSSN